MVSELLLHEIAGANRITAFGMLGNEEFLFVSRLWVWRDVESLLESHWKVNRDWRVISHVHGFF